MVQLITASANRPLDLLTELICAAIQLSTTQHECARQHYTGVTGWLAREGSAVAHFSPDIFPHGSLGLGTTTKPLRRAEFDLDLTCQVEVSADCHPGQVYKLIWDRMELHKMYKKIMQRLPRCIRLNYAGDFHLDIVPAIPDREAGGKCILVPDLDADLAFDHPKNDRWKPSNPLGYQGWFEGRCVRFRSKYALEANVAPFPDQEHVGDKPALKRAVQLFKRWRDKEFRLRQHLAPPSIILTTLCGHLYLGEPLCTDALQTILNRIVAILDSGEPICLKNPANEKESICEKWERDPKSFEAFDRAVRRFCNRWERLLQLEGIDDITAELTDLFEDEPTMPVKKAVEEYARRRVGDLRQSGKLMMERQTGRIGAAVSAGAISVPPHTYFGNAKHSA